MSRSVSDAGEVRAFLMRLVRMRSVWRLTYGASPGGRRQVKRRIGEERRRWIALHGRHDLDGWAVVTASTASDPDRQYILLPRAVPEMPPTRREARKQLKSMLREALAERWNGDLLGPTKQAKPHRLVRGSESGSAAANGGAVRARGLPRLGVAILDNATEGDVATMRHRGFDVIPNLDITVPRPVTVDAPQVPSPSWHLPHIGIDPSHMRFGGRGVIIGILDTGIAHHREFEGKVVHYRCFREDGAQHADQSRRDHDRHGSHGTHVSAIAAGRHCGVAPEADLCVAAVLTVADAHGMTGKRTQVLKGLEWLIETAAKARRPMVVNASLAGSGYDGYLQLAIQGALVGGVLVVAAIGNDGDKISAPTHGSPANYADVLAVGATDQSDHVCDFSGWGVIAEQAGISKPDVCAPGHLIWSAMADPRCIDRYAFKSGTSMAAPVVSGLAALLLASDPNLARDPTRLRRSLVAKTRPAIGPVQRSGAGIVRA